MAPAPLGSQPRGGSPSCSPRPRRGPLRGVPVTVRIPRVSLNRASAGASGGGHPNVGASSAARRRFSKRWGPGCAPQSVPDAGHRASPVEPRVVGADASNARPWDGPSPGFAGSAGSPMVPGTLPSPCARVLRPPCAASLTGQTGIKARDTVSNCINVDQPSTNAWAKAWFANRGTQATESPWPCGDGRLVLREGGLGRSPSQAPSTGGWRSREAPGSVGACHIWSQALIATGTWSLGHLPTPCARPRGQPASPDSAGRHGRRRAGDSRGPQGGSLSPARGPHASVRYCPHRGWHPNSTSEPRALGSARCQPTPERGAAAARGGRPAVSSHELPPGPTHEAGPCAASPPCPRLVSPAAGAPPGRPPAWGPLKVTSTAARGSGPGWTTSGQQGDAGVPLSSSLQIPAPGRSQRRKSTRGTEAPRL